MTGPAEAGLIDPEAPTGGTAIELSKTVEPEYRRLVTDYFERLSGGR